MIPAPLSQCHTFSISSFLWFSVQTTYLYRKEKHNMNVHCVRVSLALDKFMPA